MSRQRKSSVAVLTIRALRTQQADGIDIYAFFVPGADLLRFAEISRIHRSSDGSLHGFQRKHIRNHVRSIVEFLDQGSVLFPNAIILAISPQVVFTQSRGSKPDGDVGTSQAGTLRIPISSNGAKAAWIVDGQQRSIALAEAKNKSFPVPVVAFVSEDLATHREQFILVNKARPLPSRLINELLPEVETRLPRDLAPRRIPSAIVHLLATVEESPFRGLISRISDEYTGTAVVVDTALLKAVRNSINSPLGALAPYKASSAQEADCAAMIEVLLAFWRAVARVFPEAWGKSPTQSRLMHSAGIEAMGYLMDRVMARAPTDGDLHHHAVESLTKIAPYCCWTSGRWPDIDRQWSDIQNINRDIKLLSEQLARLDHTHSMSKVV
ncbi:DGQHR domain-containing protein DpdB [Roseibium marinum]|uniref:DGQHR domain-containing protein n=1 Tax=Roseibium marinum TaxID=281252 RepID=A0A2S3UYC5_9HYPH|nr:DGQHR domain-containing protein DpdB [Roseibium marinum]POF32600.1 DGQHR domain-containing protein [Roseibium marinum]